MQKLSNIKNNIMPVLSWRWWAGIVLVGAILWALPSLFTVLLSGVESPLIGPFQHMLVIALAIATILIFNMQVRKLDFGLENIKISKLIIWSIIGLCFTFGIQYAAYYIFPQGVVESSKEVFNLFGFGQSAWKDFWTLFYITLSGPMAEEFVFRGVIFRSIRDGMARMKMFSSGLLSHLPLIAGVVLSSYLFISMHEGVQGPQLFGMFFISCVLALSYYLTRSLYVPIMIHTVNNSYVIYNQIKTYGEGAMPASTYSIVILMPVISMIIVYAISRLLKN